MHKNVLCTRDNNTPRPGSPLVAGRESQVLLRTLPLLSPAWFLALSVWTLFENFSRLEQKNLENLEYGKLSTPSKWCNGCSRKLVAQLVKTLSALQDTWVRSLGGEAPLEKGLATNSSILAWRISWTVQYMGSQRVRYSWVTFTFILSKIKTMKRSLKYSEILVHFGSALMPNQRAGLRICKLSLFVASVYE